MNVTDKTRAKWVNKCLSQGLCSHCGKEPLIGKSSYGYYCLRKYRRKAQEKHGFKPWKPGSKGPVPIEHQPKAIEGWVKKMRALCIRLEDKGNKRRSNGRRKVR